MSNTHRKIAWDKIFREFAINRIDYKIVDNCDISFKEEHYNKGVAIIEKYLPEYKSGNLN